MKHDRFKVEKTGRHEWGVREYIENPDTGKAVPGNLVYGGFTDKETPAGVCEWLNKNPELSWADVAKTLDRWRLSNQRAERLLYMPEDELREAVEGENSLNVLFRARDLAERLGMASRLETIEKRLEALSKEEIPA